MEQSSVAAWLSVHAIMSLYCLSCFVAAHTIGVYTSGEEAHIQDKVSLWLWWWVILMGNPCHHIKAYFCTHTIYWNVIFLFYIFYFQSQDTFLEFMVCYSSFGLIFLILHKIIVQITIDGILDSVKYIVYFRAQKIRRYLSNVTATPQGNWN